MPIIYIMALGLEDRTALEEVVARGSDWRCRERAKLSAESFVQKAVAILQ